MIEILSRKATRNQLIFVIILFCEIISWAHSNSKGIQDLENRLNGLGYQIVNDISNCVK